MALPYSIRALGSPNFRRYYAGQAVSMIGTWVQSVALMWLAYRLSGSTWFTGLVGFLQSVPQAVRNVERILETGFVPVELPELRAVFERICASRVLRKPQPKAAPAPKKAKKEK